MPSIKTQPFMQHKKTSIWTIISWTIISIFVMSTIRRITILDVSIESLMIIFHKIGEVLIGIPLFLAFRSSQTGKRSTKEVIQHYGFWILLGGIFNLIAGIGLWQVIWWDWFCFLIFGMTLMIYFLFCMSHPKP